MNGPNHQSHRQNPIRAPLVCCIGLAGLGGITPTLLKLAATYSKDPTSPLPAAGAFFAIFLYFIIGIIACLVFSERNLWKAFVLGASAPGILTNVFAGYQEPGPAMTTIAAHTPSFFDSFSFVQTANAAQPREQPTPMVLPKAQLREQPADRSATISLRVDLGSAGKWDRRNTPITVAYRDGTQRTSVGTYAPVEDAPFNFVVPSTASILEILVADQRFVTPVPKGFSFAELTLKLVLEGRSDFVWALGGKRKPSISQASLVWTDGDIPVKNVSLSRLMNKLVKNTSGRTVGKVRGLELTRDGRPRLVILADTAARNSNTLGTPFELERITETPDDLEIVVGAKVKRRD